jgi:hypothetical protein
LAAFFAGAFLAAFLVAIRDLLSKLNDHSDSVLDCVFSEERSRCVTRILRAILRVKQGLFRGKTQIFCA